MIWRLIVAALLSGHAYAADFSQFGGIGDGVTDNTPALDAAISNLCATNERRLTIGGGTFIFNSEPRVIPCGLNIEGEGPGATILMNNFSGGALLHIVGGIDFYNGGIIRDLAIQVPNGIDAYYAIWVQAHLETDPNAVTRNPHGILIDNLRISRGGVAPWSGVWHYGIYLDGTQNASPPAGVAMGIRYARIRETSVSGYTILPFLGEYLYGGRFIDDDCYIPLNGAPLRIEVEHDAGTTEQLGSQSCPLMATP